MVAQPAFNSTSEVLRPQNNTLWPAIIHPLHRQQMMSQHFPVNTKIGQGRDSGLKWSNGGKVSGQSWFVSSPPPPVAVFLCYPLCHGSDVCCPQSMYSTNRRVLALQRNVLSGTIWYGGAFWQARGNCGDALKIGQEIWVTGERGVKNVFLSKNIGLKASTNNGVPSGEQTHKQQPLTAGFIATKDVECNVKRDSIRINIRPAAICWCLNITSVE